MNKMIIYFYLLIPIVFQSSDSSSIRGRNYKNDLVPFTNSRLEPYKKDNDLKIVSNEPFIIQMQMPKGHVNKVYKETNKKRKRPMKKRVSKIKPLRKNLRTRRDLQKLKSIAVRKKKSIQSDIPRPVNGAELQFKNLTKNAVSRVELLKALSSHPKKKENKRNKVEGHFKDDDKNNTTKNNSRSRHFPKNHISLSDQPPTVKMVYPSTPKPDRHPHKYTYQDLVADRKRLEQKINYIKNILKINDSSTDNMVRIRRRSESDRAANKITKMFLTLSAVNGLNDKRKLKCRDGEDEDDRMQDVWEKEQKNSPSRKNSSSNEERYKVKKWIEFMKNKRSSGKTCTCMENHYGEEGDVFPLEQKVSKDYFLKKKSKSSEESSESYGDSYYSREKFSRNNNRKFYKEDPEDQLKGLIKNSQKKPDFPFNELELYRSRAKEILRNAEEILDKIKEEEEKRLATPNILMNHLKELTARIQEDPRNNENDLIRKIQKSFGWSNLPKSQDGPDGNSGSTFVDNIKSYILDPYEKAKALSDESTKKLSTYLLQNLGKLQESSEEQLPRQGNDKSGNLQVYFGEAPQKEEKKPQLDSLAKDLPTDLLTINKGELQKGENSTSISGSKEAIKDALRSNQEDAFKQRIEDIMKEQQKKLGDYELTNNSEDNSKEIKSVGEAKEIKEVKSDLPTGGGQVTGPKEVSRIDQNPKGEIKATNPSRIYDSGSVEQKPTPEESFQKKKHEKDPKSLQEKKELEIPDEIIEASYQKEQVNDNQNPEPKEKQQSQKSQLTGEDAGQTTLRIEQGPEEVGGKLKAEKNENLEVKKEGIQERNEETQEREEKKQESKEGTSGKKKTVQENTDPLEKISGKETDVLASPRFIPEDYDFMQLENGQASEEKETFKEALEDDLNEYSSNKKGLLRMEELNTESSEEAGAESDLLSELLVDPSHFGEKFENLEESSRFSEQEKKEDPSVIQTEDRVQESLENEDLVGDVSESKEANELTATEGKTGGTLLEESKSNEGLEEGTRNGKQIVELEHSDAEKTHAADDQTRKENNTAETSKAVSDEQVDPENLEARIEESTINFKASNLQENVNDTLRAISKEQKDSDDKKPDESVKATLDGQNPKIKTDEDTPLKASKIKNPENQKNETVESTNDEIPLRKTSEISNFALEISAEENTTLGSGKSAEESKGTNDNSNETIMKEAGSNEEVAISNLKEQETALQGTSLEKNEEEEKAINSNDGIDKPTLKAILSEEDLSVDQKNAEESSLKKSNATEGLKESVSSIEARGTDEKNFNEDEEKLVLKLKNPDEENQRNEESEEKESTSAEKISNKPDQEEILLKKADLKEKQDEQVENMEKPNLKAEDPEEGTELANLTKETPSSQNKEEKIEETPSRQTDAEEAVQNSELEGSSGEALKAALENEDNTQMDDEKNLVKAENMEESNEEDQNPRSGSETLEATINNINQENIGAGTDETVKAVVNENPSVYSGDETVEATADDENQETVDAGSETVEATADDENQETVDAGNETVEATADDENQETVDAGNETVEVTAEDENQETVGTKKDETVKAVVNENPSVYSGDETLEVTADDKNQETADSGNETIQPEEIEEGGRETPLRATLNDQENEEEINEDESFSKGARKNDEAQPENSEGEKADVGAVLDQESKESDEKSKTRQNTNEDENVEASLRANDPKNLDDTNETEKSENVYQNQETGDENPLKSASSGNELKGAVDGETSLKSAKPMDEADAELSKEGNEESMRADDLNNYIDEKSKTETEESAKYDEETENPDESHEKVRAEIYLGENLIADDRLQEAEDPEEKINEDSSLSDLIRMSHAGKKLEVPKSIGEIMKYLEEKEKDDITSVQNLNPEKIDHIIDKIGEAEQQNLLGSQELDCRKECACADEIDTRSRNMGRYEIVKDFLHWMKDLQLNRVL